jgi:hypothetical protein
MTCTKSKSLLSPYLDGKLTGAEMQAIAAHISGCGECRREFAMLRVTQGLVAKLGPKKAPPELSLRLRVALSQEASLTPRRRLQALLARAEEAFNSMLVPATAGAVTAIVFFGLLMGFFTLPTPLEAANDGSPALFYTPPELAGTQFTFSNSPGSLMVEAVIDENGRVVDWNLMSERNKETDKALPEIKNMLLFTVFRPATLMGKPTTSRVVLSFSAINVRG